MVFLLVALVVSVASGSSEVDRGTSIVDGRSLLSAALPGHRLPPLRLDSGRARAGRLRLRSRLDLETQLPTRRLVLRPSLLDERREAVRRGVRWLRWYVARHWSYRELGNNAVYIFRELAETTADDVVRRICYPVARRLALRMKAYYLGRGRIDERDDLLEAIDLLTFHRVLHFDPQPLLDRVLARFSRYRTAEALYDVDLDRLDRLDDDDLFDLLINTYVLEKAWLTLSPQLATDFHLGQLIRFLRQRPYVEHDKDTSDDQDHFYADAYLATHVAFVFTNYGVAPLRRADVPRVYPFLRRSFPILLAAKHIELVAELLDVYRSMGRSERNDGQVERGTRFLLRTQASDGSWGPWRKEKSRYDAVHYTWAAVHGLRDRTLRRDTRYERHLERLLDPHAAIRRHVDPSLEPARN
ncbi:MAG: hypothetical protein KC609_09050 [Myxococcales bacterium]|nr:hypothetical protein [Myxococcales bacterium]